MCCINRRCPIALRVKLLQYSSGELLLNGFNETLWRHFGETIATGLDLTNSRVSWDSLSPRSYNFEENSLIESLGRWLLVWWKLESKIRTLSVGNLDCDVGCWTGEVGTHDFLYWGGFWYSWRPVLISSSQLITCISAGTWEYHIGVSFNVVVSFPLICGQMGGEWTLILLLLCVFVTDCYIATLIHCCDLF